MELRMLNREYFEDYMVAFLAQNSMLNLVSKNDAKLLWEKHIFDSLAIEKVFEKYGIGKKLLDIGTGGGFPSVPIALEYNDIEVYALDSIRKKINAIENLKAELKIKNLHTICDRAENVKMKFDIITSRAVAPLNIITGYAAPLLAKNGIFVAYKSRRSEEEIEDSKNVLNKYSLRIKDIISYDLPLEDNFTRNLIIIGK